MKNTRKAYGWMLALVIVGSFAVCAHSAGFELAGASVTLTGPMILSTMDDVTLSSGSFGAGNALVQVSGNWTQIAGTFVPGTSTVTFQGASSSTSTLSGSTTFYSLQCVTAGKTLSFTAGSTQTVIGSLILTGSVGNTLQIRSTSAGLYAYLTNRGINTVTNVDVQDNNAGGGLTIFPRPASANSGPNVNWAVSPSPPPPAVDC